MPNWKKISSIVDRALDLKPYERKAFVEEVCVEDPALKASVTEFLTNIDSSEGLWDKLVESGSILASEIIESDSKVDISPLYSPLEQAGPYRIIKLIARGGMGNVFLAERSDGQFKRKVAVKILRRELGSENYIQRFTTERNILSGLEHPNIARLYDGGVTKDNRPYLVMEYVDGVPITSYCKNNNSSLDEKLDLFKQVCKAVEFAHRNLIVHRDLKPDNILVKPDGTVKVLDFGIAKIINEDLSAEMLEQTRENQHMLSIQYAAPEQITIEKVTTSTDVYSLGLLLYEIITGRPPFKLKGKNLVEAEKIIRFEMPEKPSSAISDPGLIKKVRGDLDSVILCALHKDPERRYSGVVQMEADIYRYQANLPIPSRSDSFRYRFKKYTRRRPWVIVAGITVFLTITAYLITLQLYTDRLEMERNRAQLEAEKSEQISNFVVMLFEGNNPDVHDGEIPSVSELLERGVERAELLGDQPEVSARLLDTIGLMYVKLGRFQDAEPLFRRVVSIRRSLQTEPHPELASSLDWLGDALLRMGYYEDAEQVLLEALEVAQGSGEAVIEANILNDLGLVYYGSGNFAKAEDFHRRSLQLRQKHLGNLHYKVGTSLHNIALAAERQFRMDEAEEMYIMALSIKKTALGEEHSAVTNTLSQLGRVYSETGNFEKATELFTEALEINRRRLGAQHPRIAENLNEIAAQYSRINNNQMAEELFRESLAIREATLESNSLDIALSLSNLVTVLNSQEKFSEGLPLIVRAVGIARERWGTGHINTAIFIHNLGSSQLRLQLFDEAEINLRESIEIMSRTIPNEHELNAHPMMRLGELLTSTDRAAEAEPYLRKALELRINGDSSPADIAQAEFHLGVSLSELSRFEEAETLLRKSLKTRMQLLGGDHQDVLATRSQLERVHTKLESSN